MSDIADRVQAGEWGADIEAAAEIRRLTAQLEQIRAATIEECAQRLEKVIWKEPCCERAAAAIRALKEQE